MGRKNLSREECTQHFGKHSNYISLSMRDISTLPENLKRMSCPSYEGAVFFNFAWSGKNSLADGSYSDQLENAVWSAEAVKVAKAIGCSKFINSGSTEESFIEAFLNIANRQKYKSAQSYYGLAKLASRDLCRMVAYMNGIDYIHTRMSVPLESDLSKGTYIALTMRKILNGEEYERPRSTSLYDLVLLEDVARAYHLIGQIGLNKADYYIGTGKPATLQQHFERLSRMIENRFGIDHNLIDTYYGRIFDVQRLRQDTSFVAVLGLQSIIDKVGK